MSRPRHPDAANEVVQWLRWQQNRGFSAATLRRRRVTLNNWVERVGRDRMFSATYADVEDFICIPTAPASRRAYLADLRSFYKWAARRDLTTNDPTTRVDIPRVPKRLPTPVTAADVRRAIDAAPRGGRVRCAIALAAYAGLRVNEIAHIDAEHIDFATRIVTVRNGKGGKDRHVPISAELLEELLQYPVRSGPLFPTMNHGDSVSRAIKLHLRSLGIQNRPHDLRAAFATQLAHACNGNLLAVARLCGHESVTTTERYVGWRPELAPFVEGLYGART